MIEEEMGMRYVKVRCEECNARLFDTDGRVVEWHEKRIEIFVRCWRCGAVREVLLADTPDRALAAIRAGG